LSLLGASDFGDEKEPRAVNGKQRRSGVARYLAASVTRSFLANEIQIQCAQK
jgi:hypothetical protein